MLGTWVDCPEAVELAKDCRSRAFWMAAVAALRFRVRRYRSTAAAAGGFVGNGRSRVLDSCRVWLLSMTARVSSPCSDTILKKKEGEKTQSLRGKP